MIANRWLPYADVWSEMDRLHNEMNRVFDRYGYSNRSNRNAPTYPALDLWQDESNLYLEAELPGMELDDLEIYVSGENQLGLKGSRKVPAVDNAAWHRRERSYGEFARVISLPQAVDSAKVEAEMKNGVLTVTLPKVQAALPRKIEVKAN